MSWGGDERLCELSLRLGVKLMVTKLCRLGQIGRRSLGVEDQVQEDQIQKATSQKQIRLLSFPQRHPEIKIK
jgi:hypothetical protein